MSSVANLSAHGATGGTPRLIDENGLAPESEVVIFHTMGAWGRVRIPYCVLRKVMTFYSLP